MPLLILKEVPLPYVMDDTLTSPWIVLPTAVSSMVSDVMARIVSALADSVPPAHNTVGRVAVACRFLVLATTSMAPESIRVLPVNIALVLSTSLPLSDMVVLLIVCWPPVNSISPDPIACIADGSTPVMAAMSITSLPEVTMIRLKFQVPSPVTVQVLPVPMLNVKSSLVVSVAPDAIAKLPPPLTCANVADNVPPPISALLPSSNVA
mmetsp:Transcript_17034/g.18972  ORF Transcript_17034/g.18972 Transcript_17034/m.18972 type:complete len:208 (+) Transcript_17034:1553-2176(+)